MIANVIFIRKTIFVGVLERIKIWSKCNRPFIILRTASSWRIRAAYSSYFLGYRKPRAAPGALSYMGPG